MEPMKTDSDIPATLDEPLTLEALRAWREGVTGIPHGYVQTDAERDDVYKAWAPPHLAKPDRNGVVWQPKTALGKKVRAVRQNRGKLAIAERCLHSMTLDERQAASMHFLRLVDVKGLDDEGMLTTFDLWAQRALFLAATKLEAELGELPWRASPPDLLARVKKLAFG